MECNKEEALRAKEMAEKRFQEQDYVGAKKLILKAQKLFPMLESIPQMLAVCEVHCVAQAKMNGSDIDWYKILQLDHAADDALIKKQYRKLALLLHPDKNKFYGAEAAFKLIGQAMSVLSDSIQRAIFTSKRAVFTSKRNTSAKPNNANTTARQNYEPNNVNAAAEPDWGTAHINPEESFWTICTHCTMRYLYYKNIKNRYILCPSCQRPFLAKEICSQDAYGESFHGMAGPSNTENSAKQRYQKPDKEGVKINQKNSVPNASTQGAHPYSSANINSSRFTQEQQRQKQAEPRQRPNGAADTSNKRKAEASTSAETFTKGNASKRKKNKHEDEAEGREKMREENIQKEALRKLQKERDKGAEKAGVNGKSRRRSKKVNDSTSTNSDTDDSTMEDYVDNEWRASNGEVGADNVHRRRSSRAKRNVSYIVQGSDDEDFAEIPSMKKSKIVNMGNENENQTSNINEKISEATNIHVKEDRVQHDVNDLPMHDETFVENLRTFKKATNGNDGKLPERTTDNKLPERTTDNEIEDISLESTSGSSSECSDLETFEVPDPDFYHFDNDRTEDKIQVGQVWAAYDNVDGMPRYYCRINKVSNEPFECQISWLEWKRKMRDTDFSVGCGIFKKGKSSTIESINSFSHFVQWAKGKQIWPIEILPRKGDVWAIYKNWNFDLQVPKDGEENVEYEMVEIVSDFSESLGIEIAFLTKLDGFKVIFKRRMSSAEQFVYIPPDQLRRFSHQVPAHRKTGEEGDNVPKDSLELDPAAMPSELIHLRESEKKGR